ncbi:MAG: Holliday junction branch migration protein RuvA [Magnetococcales bacterium]|nr:Holliday junction branch migration protein RuvA [Magnetococcales bacterium]
MITQLKGILIEKDPDRAVLDVGGVCYELLISQGTFNKLRPLGDACHLFTELRVPEGDIRLYGFATRDERTLFNLLTTVPGIGPKFALAILGVFDPVLFADLIKAGDHKRLLLVPGIGLRNAQRLCVDLKERLPVFGGVAGNAAALAALRKEVHAGLLRLGYRREQVDEVVHSLPGDIQDAAEAMKLMLRALAPPENDEGRSFPVVPVAVSSGRRRI